MNAWPQHAARAATVDKGLAPHVEGRPPAEVRLPAAYEDEQQRQRDELEDQSDYEELVRERNREWFE